MIYVLRAISVCMHKMCQYVCQHVCPFRDIFMHGSHWGWKSGKTWKNAKAFSSQGKVRVFCQDWKSQGILLKIWKNQKKLYWKIEKNTGKVREICQPVLVKTLEIWYHTLNKKRTLKNTGKLQKILEKSGKIFSPKKWEPCYVYFCLLLYPNAHVAESWPEA